MRSGTSHKTARRARWLAYLTGGGFLLGVPGCFDQLPLYAIEFGAGFVFGSLLQ